MIDYPLLSQYLRSGIGDLNDLQFQTGVAEGGKWVGLVHPGWYWMQAKIGYLYSQEGSYETTVESGIQSVTVPQTSGTPLLYWAPVTIRSADKIYTLLTQTYKPMQTLSWSITNDVASAELPSDSYLLTMRNKKGQEFAHVVGIRDLVDVGTYCVSGTTVYIRSRSEFPDAFADVWSYSLPCSSLLRVCELSEAASETEVYAKHRYLHDATISFGYESCVPSFSDNLMTHSLTGVVRGDLLKIEYYVPYSYAVLDSETVGVYTPVESTLEVLYEQAPPGASVVVSTSGSPLQLNPLFGGIRTGYLIANSSDTPLWTDDIVVLKLYTDVKTSIIPAWNEPFRILAVTTDRKGRRVGNVPVTWTAQPTGVGILNEGITNIEQTDGRGECHLLCLPSSGCESSLTFTAYPKTQTSSTVSITIGTAPVSSQIGGSQYTAGNLTLFLNTDRTLYGALKMLGQYTTLDQIPWIATKSLLNTTKVKLVTRKGRIYDSSKQTQPINLDSTDPNRALGAIQWDYFAPLVDDKVFLSRKSGDRMIHSNVLSIPGGTNV